MPVLVRVRAGRRARPTPFETGFDHVVGVFAGQVDVDGAFEGLGQRGEEVADHFGVQAADRFAREFAVEDKGRAAGQVDRNPGQRFVHRQDKTVPAHADPVTQGLVQCLAQRQGAVFHGVVFVDLEIAATVEFETESPVAGDLVEHMIEKNRCRCRSLPAGPGPG